MRIHLTINIINVPDLHPTSNIGTLGACLLSSGSHLDLRLSNEASLDKEKQRRNTLVSG